MDKKELTIGVLKDAADNLNELFDPPMQTEDIDLLKKDLVDIGIGLIDDDQNELSEETQRVLVSLGVKLPWNSEEIVMEIEPIEEPPETEIETEIVKVPLPETEIVKVKTKQKDVQNVKEDINSPIITDSDNNDSNNDNNDINIVTNANNNNNDRGDNDKNIKKSIKISRMSFYHQAVKELCKLGATRQEIMERSDKLYRENGGTAKFKATTIAYVSLGALIKFNILVEDENKKLKLA